MAWDIVYRTDEVEDDYFLDFTALEANESPISQGGVWVTPSPNVGMQVRLSADTTTRICCETGSTPDYDDSTSFVVEGFPGDQRVDAVLYRQAGYFPPLPDPNHEMEVHVGFEEVSGGKRCVELGFNTAGGYFIAGFDGNLTSWQAPPDGIMSSPWSAAATGLGSAPADGDLFRMELNRSAKTIKCWQNSVLIIDLQWNDTAIVTSAAQAVLNALGGGAGLGGLRRPGAGAIEGAWGWRSVRISSTLLGEP